MLFLISSTSRLKFSFLFLYCKSEEMLVLLDVCLTDLGDTLCFIISCLWLKKSLLCESAKIYGSWKQKIPQLR